MAASRPRIRQEPARLAVLAELRPYRNRVGLDRVLLIDRSRARQRAWPRSNGRPHATECASPLDQPFVQSHDQDESSLLDVLEWAQRTGVIDRADAALLIELMLAADEARKVDQNGLAGRGSTTPRRARRQSDTLEELRVLASSKASHTG